MMGPPKLAAAATFLAVILASWQTADALFFYDDFETGLDPSTWYLENINGAEWEHTTLAGNGCIVSNEPSPWGSGNRYLDIHTQYDDFSDFTMTWDMLFATGGTHGDLRSVYFRGDNSSNVVGYWIYIGVNRPWQTPSDQLGIMRRNGDGSWEHLTPTVEYPWDLDQWYSFKLQAVGNEFKLRIWDQGSPEPLGWTLEATDEAPGGYATGRLGFGNYWASQTFVDNVGVIPEPSTLVLVSVGLLALSGLGGKRFRGRTRP